MSTITGIVEAIKNTPMQGAILVGGDWYSSYRGTATASVTKGDMVEFSWQPDKTGKWKNIKTLKIITKGAGGPSVPVVGVPYIPRHNLGVELGHASNLAMKVVLAACADEALTEPLHPGSDAFYKEFARQTDKVYKIMRKLREGYEKSEAPKTEVKAAKPEPVIAADDDADEPF